MKSPPSKQSRKRPGEFQVQRRKHLARAATDLALKHLRAGLSVTLKALEASTGKWVLASVAPLVEDEEPSGLVFLIAGRIPQVGIPYDKDGRCCLSADKRYPWTEVDIRGRVVRIEPLP